MSERPKVIVDPHFRAMGDVFSAEDARRLAGTVEVVWGHDEPMPEDVFREALPDAFAIVSAGWRYGPVLDVAENLRAILTVSGGWPPELDYGLCFERGIRVLSAAPGFAGAVAELALALALASSRDIAAGDRAMRAGEERWLSSADELETFLLFGKRVGFVGFGSIGRRLKALIEPFGCEVCAYDPWLTDAFLREERVEPTELDTLLETSRVIFVLATPTTENEALLSRKRLELLAPDALLVLVSRAHVVDFEALTELVLAGRFRAAIDVYPSEPFAAEHPIRNAPGVVLSPHRAGLVQEALWELGRLVVDDLEAMVRGLPPRRMQVAEPELATRYVRTTQLVQRAEPEPARIGGDA
ncbi:MAG: hydroxyacid dehydrogenase [Actinobacteria bacterium]|nr:hydroxyacid dehydrogenase [Actinomycetota bacterium]